MADAPPSQETALEHLRVIRTLMERAHIYRAVSAPAAFTGGVLALGLAAYGVYQNAVLFSQTFRWPQFLTAWLVLLLVCTVLNLVLLMRESKGRGLPFVTDGLRTALRCVTPPLLAGGVVGIGLIVYEDQIELAALLWILCYGLALLATASFAPRSILWLGRAFLWSGLALSLFWFIGGGLGMIQRPEAAASLLLGLTFGLFHIIYAIVVFLRKPTPAA